jgi:hypothetical protein
MGQVWGRKCAQTSCSKSSLRARPMPAANLRSRADSSSVAARCSIDAQKNTVHTQCNSGGRGA